MEIKRPCWYRGAKEALGVVQLLCSDTLHVKLCRLGPADEDITPSDVPVDPPNRYARSNDLSSNASTQFRGELVLKRSFSYF